MNNHVGFEIELAISWENDTPKLSKFYGIENEQEQIVIKPALTLADKKKNARHYKYYDFEKYIDCPPLIEAMRKYVAEYDFSQIKTKYEVTILEFVVDDRRNFYFKGSYLDSENKYSSALYDYNLKIFGKEMIVAHSKLNEPYFIQAPKSCINYAELLLNVVSQTDQENWDYFSEDSSALAKDFLEYGYFSRVLMVRSPETLVESPVGYVQLRVLKETAPQLLYKDLYHYAGLDGIDLWEQPKYLKAGMPIYVDVIALKQEYQHNNEILKLVPQALQDMFTEIEKITDEEFEIYAVGVTDEGRKMCQMLKMEQLSEAQRTEDNITHTRTLFKSSYFELDEYLNKMLHIKSKRKI